MEKFVFKHRDQDGSSTVGDLSLGTINIETPGILPILRTTQSPNDLKFLVNCKAQHNLEHIQGGVVRLYSIPKLVIPEIEYMKEQEKTPALDGFKDPFTKFCDSNILICDPAMEYTHFSRKKQDDKFVDNLYFCNRLVRFFKEFESSKKELRYSDESKSVRKLRQEMCDELWLGNSRQDRNERNKMVEQLTLYQLSYLSIPTPIGPLVTSPEYLDVSIELNDLSQGLAYSNNRESFGYVPFHPSCIKEPDLLAKYLDHVRTNDSTKLYGMKFKDLDLHCPVDYKARRGFKQFMEDIVSLKQDKKDRAFMLLDAGTQYYAAFQAFEIVCTSMTGFDQDVDGATRKKGQPMTIHWWDQHKMWSRPVSDSPVPEPDHCPYCNSTPNFDIENSILNRRRRGHRLFDLNNDASQYCQHVGSKDIGFHMRKRVANAEFSYATDLILSP